MKELVKEKMEEKVIELSARTGRPRSKKSKRVIMTEEREKERKNALERYYKRKAIAVN